MSLKVFFNQLSFIKKSTNISFINPFRLKANELGDVVVANAVYSVGAEPREIIFFREGGIVFWNCTEMEASNVLDFVRPYVVCILFSDTRTYLKSPIYSL